MVKELHVVLGGGGYPGLHLAQALQQQRHHVRLFDIAEPPDGTPEGMDFRKGDVRKVEDVKEALTGADCVYHMASYGMSGREQYTCTWIDTAGSSVFGLGLLDMAMRRFPVKWPDTACCDCGVTRLVYTSTYNVVFGGQTIQNGDESLPYFPIDKHPDHYSRTKAMAEMAVMAADGSHVKTNKKNKKKPGECDCLHTCALRLAGVYGPGERRHLPRIVDYIERGLFSFTHGDVSSLVEFLHVDNLAQAHVLAGKALSQNAAHKAAGQVYFISDCKPVNNFEFFRPLIEGLGYSYPRIKLPLSFVYFFALLTEFIHFVVGRVYNFQPLLTRAEVFKTGVTHYFSNEKAKKELGYQPTIQNDLTEVVKWFRHRGHGKALNEENAQLTADKHMPQLAQQRPRSVRWLLDIILAVLFASLVLSYLPSVS